MIRLIDDLFDVGEFFDDHPLHALTQRYTRHAATLTTTTHTHVYYTVYYVNEFDPAAMGRNCRIDVIFDELLDLASHLSDRLAVDADDLVYDEVRA
jgi:hypothetical protein